MSFSLCRQPPDFQTAWEREAMDTDCVHRVGALNAKAMSMNLIKEFRTRLKHILLRDRHPNIARCVRNLEDRSQN